MWKLLLVVLAGCGAVSSSIHIEERVHYVMPLTGPNAEAANACAMNCNSGECLARCGGATLGQGACHPQARPPNYACGEVVRARHDIHRGNCDSARSTLVAGQNLLSCTEKRGTGAGTIILAVVGTIVVIAILIPLYAFQLSSA